MYSILFVCLGNICRSPTAEAVFRSQAEARDVLDQLHLDSAGTGDWHIGKSPDPRAQQAGLSRGYNLSVLTARQVNADDFEQFDLILAMDHSNLSDLKNLKGNRGKASVRLFLDYASSHESEVPDPYYGGHDGFDYVLDLVEQASTGLLDHLSESGVLT